MAGINKDHIADAIISNPDGYAATVVRNMKNLTAEAFLASLTPPGSNEPSRQWALDMIETLPPGELTKQLVICSPEN